MVTNEGWVSSPPKITAVDADWIASELDRARKRSRQIPECYRMAVTKPIVRNLLAVDRG
jgi:hypothetical protein